jgi:hypothetical protein
MLSRTLNAFLVYSAADAPYSHASFKMPRSQLLMPGLLAAGALSGVWAAAAAGGEASFGPLFQEFKLTLTEGHRTEIVAPFFYDEFADENDTVRRTWAVPPFVAHSTVDELGIGQTDILWKIMSYSVYGEEYRFQFVQLFSFAGGGTQSETNVHRFTIFPIYFKQRSAIPEKNYTAFFPIYGTIKQRFARDEIHFAPFPIWVTTRRRDVVTDNYLYPVFHLRHGDNLRGWQVWPLVGYERKDFRTITNVWGDPQPIAGHRNRFVLWPIFIDQRAGLGTTNESHSQAVLPLYSWLRSPLRDSTTAPWPIGYTHTVDREKNFREWGTPWPLIVFARGSKHVDRVWPFFSHGTNQYLTSRWYLWPVYKYNRLNAPPLDRERTRIFFFLYSDIRTKDTENDRSKRRVDLWPLLVVERDMEGNRRLQMLALLESFLPRSTGLERDLSPLWSLWRSEKNPKADRSSQSLLWNLYRRDADGPSRKVSLLFGSFQYESGADGRRGRVFYIPFGKRPSAHEAASK